MNRIHLMTLFGLICVVQVLVPLSMIIKRENTLKHGEVYNFRTAPIDPYDAFRGRYVSLSFEQAIQTGNWSQDKFWRGRVLFGTLDRDSEGFARIVDLSADRPRKGNHIRVRVAWVGNGQIGLSLPFDRFYMGEFEAPRAESLFFAQRELDLPVAFAVVRVRNGFAVIEQLVVEDKPVSDWIKNFPTPEN